VTSQAFNLPELLESILNLLSSQELLFTVQRICRQFWASVWSTTSLHNNVLYACAYNTMDPDEAPPIKIHHLGKKRSEAQLAPDGLHLLRFNPSTPRQNNGTVPRPW